ncbi:spore germination protein [Clostridium sp. CX1]|uniref:Spore germination protein n=1 Tax=Clostridium tanneri TaxID=3037988 RepID=A0ABU4JQR1_9CLOT|nr:MULTISPECIES: spore germination protein [unclassified Clostridium]MCT8978437.1 spore germination protein [Clostridium sp. CX1]MDW8800467.1 spore germination protein [Clostridium sp. A1-XYC3]
MENDWNSITSKQLIAFIVSSQIGIGILTLPSTLAEDVGHDGWIVVLLAGMLFSTLTLLIMLFLRRFDGKSLIEINKVIYGKYFSLIVSLIYIIYVYFGTIVTLRAFVEMVRITILKLTPIFALVLLCLIPEIYLAWYGLKAISRFGNVIYIVLFSSIILYLFSLYDYRMDFILPIGEAGIPAILKTTLATTMSYLGPELALFIYSDIKDKDKALKYAVLGNFITTLFYTATVLVLTLFFGEEMLLRLVFPLFSFSSSHRVFVFERLDLIFVSLWMPSMGTTMLSYYFCTYYGLSKLMRIPIGTRDINSSRIALFIGILLLVVPLSLLPKTSIEIRNLLNILGYVGMGVIILTLISYFICLLRARSGLK